jgi:hypothetical protein
LVSNALLPIRLFDAPVTAPANNCHGNNAARVKSG